MPNSLAKNKKGQMGGNYTAVIPFVTSMAAVVIFIGVTMLVFAAFNDSLDTDNNASSYQVAQNVFDDGAGLFTNFSAQLGTIGTIAGILLLVVLVSLVGIAGYTYGRDKGMF